MAIFATSMSFLAFQFLPRSGPWRGFRLRLVGALGALIFPGVAGAANLASAEVPKNFFCHARPRIGRMHGISPGGDPRGGVVLHENGCPIARQEFKAQSSAAFSRKRLAIGVRDA